LNEELEAAETATLRAWDAATKSGTLLVDEVREYARAYAYYQSLRDAEHAKRNSEFGVARTLTARAETLRPKQGA
jgi:hypothetical protein